MFLRRSISIGASALCSPASFDSITSGLDVDLPELETDRPALAVLLSGT
jgi:hypothetical protein